MYVNSVPGVRISPAPPLSLTETGKLPVIAFRPVSPSPVQKSAKKSQSRQKVGNVQTGFLSIAQVAAQYSIPERTVRQWCEAGKLPALCKPYGKKHTYQVAPQAVEFLLSTLQERKEEKHKQKAQVVNYPGLIHAWKLAMQKGTMTGKAFSPLTMDYYLKNVEGVLDRHKIFNAEAVKQDFLRTTRDEYAKRFKLYKAVVSFGKFMIRQGLLDESFLQEIKPLQPKRHKPPKRTTVTETDLQTVLNACESAQERLLVLLIASTGVRASECCGIRLQDFDMKEGTLNIPIGKGGKTRKLGVTASLSGLIQNFLSERMSHHPAMALLLDSDGKPMNRYALYRTLKSIGKRAGVSVHPHALRRAFVTINANKGRSLVILQRSCGHSDIKTTMSYCMTTEQEVIDAMKAWD